MSTYYCLIPHPDQSRILLRQTPSGWVLPNAEHNNGFFDDEHGWFHLHLQTAVREQLGLYVTTLKQLDHLNIYQMENHSSEQLPSKTAWVGHEDLSNFKLTNSEHSAALENWFTDRTFSRPQAPWEKEGWFAQASVWIHQKLSTLGFTILEPIEQLKVFVFGTVLRVETEAGRFYFKALLPSVQNEPAFILELTKSWASNVPQMVAYDLDKRWMLMHDFAGESFVDFASPRYEKAVRLFAQMQLSQVPFTNLWLDLGCPNRTFSVLINQFGTVVEDALAGDSRLESNTIQQHLQMLPQLVAQVREKYFALGTYAIPLTIVQQDFQWSNIGIKDDGIVLFDWQDTVISHPFFSMARFLDYVTYSQRCRALRRTLKPSSGHPSS